MRTITIELPEGNDKIVTISAIGTSIFGLQTITNVRTHAFKAYGGMTLHWNGEKLVEVVAENE